MKICVFGDVHGNLPAFEAMLKKNQSVDAFICLGDLVNYGPFSNECVDLALSLPNCTIIMGNHESDYIQGASSSNNQIARSFFEFCFPHFNRHQKIKKFKPKYVLDNYFFTHTLNNQNIYPDTQIKLDRNYVVGHSHHQFTILQPPYTLHNPGSVGQNRAFINVINYSVYDTDTHTFMPQNIVYNVQPLFKIMKALKYPQICLDYYLNKAQK